MPSQITNSAALVAIFGTIGLASPVTTPVSNIVDPVRNAASKYGWDIPVLPEYIRKVDPSEYVTLNEIDTNTLAVDAPNITAVPFAGTIPNTHSTRDIFGADDRYLYTDGNYPWRTAGKVISQTDGGSCSAFIVGPRQVFTARHCVPQNIGSWATTFYPNYDNGNAPFGSSRIQYVLREPGGYPNQNACDIKEDWALLITVDRIGDRVGYLGFKDPDSVINQDVLVAISYPGDKDGARRPYRQDRIYAYSNTLCDQQTYTPLLTNSDSAGGASGSGLWDSRDNHAVGVLSSGSSQYTYFASGSKARQIVVDARDAFK